MDWSRPGEGRSMCRWRVFIWLGLLLAIASGGSVHASLVAAHYASLGGPGAEVTRIDRATG